MSEPNPPPVPESTPPLGVPPPEAMAPPEDAGAQALAEALRSSFRIIKFLMVVLVAAFFVSGIFTVDPNQVAIVLRFGNQTDGLLKPGLHWAFPYPIDEVVRIPVGQSHTVVSSAGWFPITPEMEAAGQLPMAMPFLRPGVDGYTLTGDGNIIHVRATLKYHLQAERAENYVFHYADPTSLLQNILNSAINHASARFTADSAIFADRQGFNELVAVRARQLIDEYNMGVAVDALEVQTSPPLEVRAEFDELVNAYQTADTKVREANTYASSTTNAALGQAQFLISDGLTRSNQIVKTVAAEAKSFSSQLPFFQQNPALFKQRLLVETMSRVLTNAQEKFFLPSRADGAPRQLRLQLSREPQKPTLEKP